MPLIFRPIVYSIIMNKMMLNYKKESKDWYLNIVTRIINGDI